MQLYGLVRMVVPRVHTTQQTFVISQFQTKNESHWLRHFHQYLEQYLPSPNKISTMDMSYIYILNDHLTFHA